MTENYNLTTKTGLEKALDNSLALKILFPHLILANKVMKHILSRKPTAEQQADTAEKLIKAGRENNVDELDIVVSNEAAAKLKIALPIKGIPIEFSPDFGIRGETKVRVKYK
jgi:hypothetical protein